MKVEVSQLLAYPSDRVWNVLLDPDVLARQDVEADEARWRGWLQTGERRTWVWDQAGAIYLFDRADSRLVRRLTGSSDVVRDLADSPDGRWLAFVASTGMLCLAA